jgi:predicted DNA-binding protein with PD1-like motif
MKYAALSNGEYSTYMLRLEAGEDIHQAVQSFCDIHNITNAQLDGIGSIENPILAHYSMKTREFHNQALTGIFEVASLLGNIALLNDEAFAHMHVTLADENLSVLGGHLVKGTCSATLEIVVKSFPSGYRKIDDDALGLKVWDFPPR